MRDVIGCGSMSARGAKTYEAIWGFDACKVRAGCEEGEGEAVIGFGFGAGARDGETWEEGEQGNCLTSEFI